MVKIDGKSTFREIEGSIKQLPCQLALLALGFTGPDLRGPIEELKIELTMSGNVKSDENWMTSIRGIFVAGDIRRGQSLIVWAIAEGRSAASAIDRYLSGKTNLPSPV